MKGTKVKGFVIGELLGSGRTGLLYHAVHESTRQKAIVRVVSREDGVETELFIQEASSHLPPNGGPELLRGTLDDGRIVHLVVNGRTRPDYQHQPTARLPPRDRSAVTQPQPRQKQRPAWVIPVIVGSIVAVVGFASTVFLLRPEPPRVTVISVSTENPPLALPVAITAPTVSDASVVPPFPKLLAAAPKNSPRPSCIFTDRYRDWVRSAVDELHTLGGGGAAFDKLEDEVGDALVEHDCARANRAIEGMRRIAGLGSDIEESKPSRGKPNATVVVEKKPNDCVPDEDWKAFVRRDLSEIETLAARNEKIQVEFDKVSVKFAKYRLADTAEDCAKISAALEQLKSKIRAAE